MTNEERDLISRFIERVGGAQAPGQAVAGQGAVAPLPPVDREADALIADLFNRYPEARYRVTQLAFVQEYALTEAQNRISRLQWELQNARQAQAPAQPSGSPWGAGQSEQPGQAQPGQSRGFFSSLFGSGGAPQPQQGPQPQYAPQQGYAAPPPPPPQYPPAYNPAAFQQQGPGFLGSALRTAAGVAGGVVAADALMSLFSGNHGGFGGGYGGGFGGGFGGFGGAPMEAGYMPGVAPAGFESPWGGAPAGVPGVDPYDVGGAPKDAPGSDKFDGPPQVDQSAWQPAPDQGGGWQQADSGSGGWQDAPSDPGDQGGGWDQASDDSGGGSDWQDT
jgi:hypothetical protein